MASALKTPFAKGLRGADLTSKQPTFVVTLVRHGCTPTQAARTAGCADGKVSSYDLLRSSHIQTAIRFERSHYIMCDLANDATSKLRSVMDELLATASAGVQAVRTVIEMAVELGRSKSDANDGCPLSQFSAEELTRLIDCWQVEPAAITTQAGNANPSLASVLGLAQLAH